MLKEIVTGYSDFIKTFSPKVPASPPPHLYKKHPNSEKEWQHKEVFVNGVNYHYVEDGDPSNQTILFLHGFPEFWYSWRFQLAHFSKSYRVIAIDMKGYGETDKPESVSAYSSQKLVEDLGDLIVELQKKSTAPNKKVILVGHDWGGIISWWLAICYGKSLFDRLVILNCPHPIAFVKNASWMQYVKSIYMYFFALPSYPELLLSRKDYGFINRCFVGKMGLVHKERFTPGDSEMYVWAFSRPRALTSALNYYRNLVRGSNLDLSPKVEIPTLVIWGLKDSVLGKDLINNLDRWVPGVKIEDIPDASHWLQQDAPERVNEIMEKWLQETTHHQ